jgi:hypothetical protein
LRRPVTEPEHDHHRPEADEERRHARQRNHDGAAADPGKEGTVALLFVGCLDRFSIGVVVWSRRAVRFRECGGVGRRTVGLARRGRVGCLVHERAAAWAAF